MGIIEKTCCFTGHRPDKLGGYNENNSLYQNVKISLKKEIEKQILKGYNKFINAEYKFIISFIVSELELN